MTKSFYFEKRMTKTSYSDDPSSGELDVMRLVSGDPAFLKEARTNKRQPKSIILANLEYDKWDALKIEAFRLRLEQLKQEGFEIYLSSGLKVDDLLKEMNLLGPNSVVMPKEALSIFLDKPIDELFFFDFDSTEAFILGDEEDYQALLGQADVALTIPISTENFNKLLTENQSILSSLNLSCFLNLQGHLAPDLSFPKLETLKCSIGSNSIKSTHLLREIVEKAGGLSRIALSGIKGVSQLLSHLPNPENLVSLSLSRSDITMEELEEIFKACPNLKELKLESYYNSLNKTLPLSLDLSSFVEIDFIGLGEALIKSESFSSLLKSAPHLKKLCIHLDESLLDGLPESFDLPVLEELGLNNCGGSLNVLLSQLLRSAPRLKSLTLDFNTDPSDLPEHLEFHSLEVLRLRSNYYLPSDQQLASVFKGIPPLKILEISSEMGSVDGDFLAGVDFSLLEEIHLNSVNITKEDFVRLLQSAPRLKRCCIENVSFFNETPGFENCFLEHVNLPLLEKLEIRHTDLSHDMVGLILSNTPKLKQVSLENCHVVERFLRSFGLKLGLDLDLSSPEEIRGLGKALQHGRADLKNRPQDWIRASLAPIFDRVSREKALVNGNFRATINQTQQYQSGLSELVKASASSTPTSMNADTQWQKTTLHTSATTHKTQEYQSGLSELVKASASSTPTSMDADTQWQKTTLHTSATTHQTQQYKSDLSELVKGSASSTPTSMDADTEWKKTTFNLKRQFIPIFLS